MSLFVSHCTQLGRKALQTHKKPFWYRPILLLIAQARYVVEQGILVAVDKVPGITHNKVMIIDDEYVLTKIRL